MLGIAVLGKLRFPPVLQAGLLFKLRLIATPSFAAFKNGFVSLHRAL